MEESSVKSVVITTLGNVDELIGCLESLPDYLEEVVVVDDSWSKSVKAFVESVPKATYHRTPMIFSGFSKSANIGVKNTSGDNLIIMHDDARFTENTHMEHMLKALQLDDIKVVVPKQLHPVGYINGTYNSFKSNDGQFSIVRMYVNNYNAYRKANIQAFVPAVDGAFMLMKREAFEEVGGFDETFVPCLFEDLDFSLKIRDNGGRLLYMPRCEVEHRRGVYVNEKKVDMQRVGGTNIQKLWDKWKDSTHLFTFEEVKTA